MSSEIILSIECLVYNHEKYLRKCLESFISQKTNYRFEVLVHDDASSDASQTIILEYAEKYPDMIVPLLEKENQYSKGAIRMNKECIYPHVKGKYFAICEGDDYWSDDKKIQKQIDYLENNPMCSFVFHNAEIINEDGRGTGRYILPNTGIKNPFWKKENHVVTMQEILRMGFIPTASIMARTSFVINRRYFVDNPVCGDLPLRLSLCLDGEGYYIDEVMSVYRTGNIESASGVARKSYENYKNTIIGQEEILKSFDKYTNYQWHEEVEYDVKRRRASCYIQFGDRKAIKEEKLWEFITTEMSKRDLFVFIMHVVFGDNYEFLRKLKRRIFK